MNKVESVKLIRVFIAGPKDTVKEANFIKKVLADWNIIHLESDKIILYPVNWKPNSVSTISDGQNGQEIINDQILFKSNILIALFKNKYGAPTSVNGKKYDSGTIAEIEEFKHPEFRCVFFIGEKTVGEDLVHSRDMVNAFKEKLQTKGGLIKDFNKDEIERFINKAVSKLKEDFDAETVATTTTTTSETVKYDFLDTEKFDIFEIFILIFLTQNGLTEIFENTIQRDLSKWQKDKHLFINNDFDSLKKTAYEACDRLVERGILLDLKGFNGTDYK
ncbi:hypothetical protein, partial [Oenococcus oeni]